MSLWAEPIRKEGEKSQSRSAGLAERDNLKPGMSYEEMPGTLDLGWHWSENKHEYQMAKISQKDRAAHFYVTGATGTGKTKFLECLILQDIEGGNGFGVHDPQ